jgi:DNA polymerase-3 subunit alpha
MEAVAMTDHGTLSGAIEFYKEATNNEIKAADWHRNLCSRPPPYRQRPAKGQKPLPPDLIAMNNTGWQNLMQLSTTANLHGVYYFPRIDHELLEQYNEGIIALSACMGGEVGNALKKMTLPKPRNRYVVQGCFWRPILPRDSGSWPPRKPAAQ